MLVENEDAFQLNLKLLEEHHEMTHLRVVKYKTWATHFYNSRVHKQSFRIGDLVLR